MSRANFLVIGAAKSGTTSLCHYLRQHPAVYVARHKESHYFAHRELRSRLNGPGDPGGLGSLLVDTEQEYDHLFADARGEIAVGEASVYYATEPKALVRALEYNPQMRFLLMLREPGARAYSAYTHMVRDRREPADTFEEALEREPERVAAGWSPSYQYYGLSDYADGIEALRAVLPEGRMHITVLEEMAADPQRALVDIFGFLGVDGRVPVDTTQIMNRSGRPRIQALNDFFVGDGAVKRGLKRLVPYEFGNRMAHRLRNWNIENAPCPLGEAQQLRFTRLGEATERVLQRPVPAWRGV